MSVFDELLAEFEQVAMARWLPLIGPYTFRTVEEPLSGEEAALLLRANRIERGERPGALTDVDRRDLDAIAARLDALLASSFAPGPGGRRRCFAKLGDRSPKDQPVEWLRARQRAAFAARLRATSDSRAPNRALQAYVWAKGQSLVVSSGAEIVALILRSERAAMELETAVEVTPHPESIVLREWVDLDPAYEFRGFVSNDQLTGLSQMASMDVILHYPHVLARKEAIGLSVQNFFRTAVCEPLRAVTSSGPSHRYVIDLYWQDLSADADAPVDPWLGRGRWWVIELNPFLTSSSGHLFRYTGADLDRLDSGPFEIRLRDHTPEDALVDVPDEWAAAIRDAGDRFGPGAPDHEAAVVLPSFGAEDVPLFAREGAPVHVILVAAGRPWATNPERARDENEEEAREWTQRAFALLTDEHVGVSPGHITVLHFSATADTSGRDAAGEGGALSPRTSAAARVRLADAEWFESRGARAVLPSSAASLVRALDAIPGPGARVVVWIVGHGKTDVDEDVEMMRRRGVDHFQFHRCTVPEAERFYATRRPGAGEPLPGPLSRRWWLQFPHPSVEGARIAPGDVAAASATQRGLCSEAEFRAFQASLPVLGEDFRGFDDATAYALHDHTLGRCVLEHAKRRGNAVFLWMGTCYSGGLLHRWLPHASVDARGAPVPLSEQALETARFTPAEARAVLGDPEPGSTSSSSSSSSSSLEPENSVWAAAATAPIVALSSSDEAVSATTTLWWKFLDRLQAASGADLPPAHDADAATLAAGYFSAPSTTAALTFEDLARELVNPDLKAPSAGHVAPEDFAVDCAFGSLFGGDSAWVQHGRVLDFLRGRDMSLAVRGRADVASSSFVAGSASSAEAGTGSLAAGGGGGGGGGGRGGGGGGGSGERSSSAPSASVAPTPSSSLPEVIDEGTDFRAFLAARDDREGTDSADALLVCGSAVRRVHSRVLVQRCASFAAVLEGRTGVSSSSSLPWVEFGADAGLASDSFHDLIEFVYAGTDGWNTWSPTRGFQRLLDACLGGMWFDLVEQLIAWREKRDRGTLLLGDSRHGVRPGWVAPSATDTSAAVDPSDWVGLAFEVEGNALQILDFYRAEHIPEDEWLALTLHERFERVGRNWALVKQRIQRTTEPYPWMNRFLTIEDAGFLWEVTYGGVTKGYTLDPQHLLEEIYKVEQAGLSEVDRDMDSGVQIHISFPKLDLAPPAVRAQVLALMVHLDDYLFLHTFPRAIFDDCNNLWTSADLGAVFRAALSDPTGHALASLVAPAAHDDPSRAQPNPAMKHKHVGLRGRDAYGPGRFGFELRRGPLDLTQLANLLHVALTALSAVGQRERGASSSGVRLRVNPDPTHFTARFGTTPSAVAGRAYGLDDVVRFVTGSSLDALTADTVQPAERAPRAAPAHGFVDALPTADSMGPAPRPAFLASLPFSGYWSSAKFADKVRAVARPWLAQLVNWEVHLRTWKRIMWTGTAAEGEGEGGIHESAGVGGGSGGGVPGLGPPSLRREVSARLSSARLGVVPTADDEMRLHADEKIQGRLGFVLLTDWSAFPSAHDGGRDVPRRLREEQRHILQEVDSILGVQERKELEASLAALRARGDEGAAVGSEADDVQWRLVRDEARADEVRLRISDFAQRVSRLY